MDPLITDAQAAQDTVMNDGAVDFPNGEQVYDSLMEKIEPELLSAHIPHLDEQYPNETEEEKAARYERYSQAFAQYDEAYAKWETELNSVVTNYRRDALSSAEAESHQADENALTQLEQSFA